MIDRTMPLQVSISTEGYCTSHVDRQLRRKKRFGGWQQIHAVCPECKMEHHLRMKKPTSSSGSGFSEDTSASHSSESGDVSTEIEDAVSALESHASSTTEQIVEIIQEIASFVSGDSEKTKEVAQAGGLKILVRVLDAYPSDEGIQRSGCACLALLAEANHENRLNLVFQCNAPPSLIRTMNQFAGQDDLVEAAGAALYQLALNPTNANRIVLSRGIPATIAALQRFPRHANIAEQGCGTLWMLAVDPKNQIQIAQGGAIPILVNAMKEPFPNADIVTKLASGALGNLAMNSDNQITIASTGVIPVLLQALKEQAADKEMVKSICSTLRNLSANSENQAAIVAGGALPYLVLALNGHVSSQGVVEVVGRTLKNVALHKDNGVSFLQTNGMFQAIANTMETHAKVAEIQWIVIGILFNLMLTDDTLLSQIPNAKIVRSLVTTTVKKHKAHPKIQKFGPQVLDKLKN